MNKNPHVIITICGLLFSILSITPLTSRAASESNNPVLSYRKVNANEYLFVLSARPHGQTVNVSFPKLTPSPNTTISDYFKITTNTPTVCKTGNNNVITFIKNQDCEIHLYSLVKSTRSSRGTINFSSDNKESTFAYVNQGHLAASRFGSTEPQAHHVFNRSNMKIDQHKAVSDSDFKDFNTYTSECGWGQPSASKLGGISDLVTSVNGIVYAGGGGFSGSYAEPSFNSYDPLTKQWGLPSDSGLENGIFRLATGGNGIIYASAYTGKGIVASYNPKTQKWHKNVPGDSGLDAINSYINALVVAKDGTLYVGANGAPDFNSYHITTKQWDKPSYSRPPNTTYGLDGIYALAVDKNGIIYSAWAGINGLFNYYDPNKKHWSIPSNPNIAPGHLASLTKVKLGADGKVYLSAATGGIRRSSDFDIYTPGSGWGEPMRSKLAGGIYALAVSTDGTVYAMSAKPSSHDFNRYYHGKWGMPTSSGLGGNASALTFFNTLTIKAID